jgi:uncharacterized protein (TIGR02646 family)
MKYISKLNEPSALVVFKKKYKEKHKIDAIYDNLYPRTKKKIKSTLLREQGFICCYCMKSITQGNSHIEHVKPRSLFSLETLNYGNMLVSCNGYNEKGENCGHNKKNWWDPIEFVTPLHPDCERIFTYGITGQMSSTTTGGKTTISNLNLNSFLLRTARKAALGMSGFFDFDFDKHKQDIVNTYSLPGKDGKFQQFCVAVVYCIKKYDKAS